jgi:hypothetical protein
LVDVNASPSLARVVDAMNSSSCLFERLELSAWDVSDKSVPVIEGSSVGSSPTTSLEESLSADMTIPEATKSPRPYVLVEETSLSVAMEAVLLPSLDEVEVRCTVAAVEFRKDALERVPFWDEEDDAEATALHSSNTTTNERDASPKWTTAITIEALTKRR